MTDIKGAFRCCVCGKPTFDQPGYKVEEGRCCEHCFYSIVLPDRIIKATVG